MQQTTLFGSGDGVGLRAVTEREVNVEGPWGLLEPPPTHSHSNTAIHVHGGLPVLELTRLRLAPGHRVPGQDHEPGAPAK